MTPHRVREPVVDVVIIGVMKCGTTSLLQYLGAHPEVSAAPLKEVNFFFGEQPGGPGGWWKGVGWYDGQFSDGGRVRAEASPGYTSPDHPGAAGRMAMVVPQARLVYLVRDPLDRAISQYRHHVRDGTEDRPLAEALLDQTSHYVRRSRFAARLAPFLDVFPADRIAVVDSTDLSQQPAATVAALQRWLGLEPVSTDAVGRRHNAAESPPPSIDPDVARAFGELVDPDAAVFAQMRRALVDISPRTPAGSGMDASS